MSALPPRGPRATCSSTVSPATSRSAEERAGVDRHLGRRHRPRPRSSASSASTSRSTRSSARKATAAGPTTTLHLDRRPARRHVELRLRHSVRLHVGRREGRRWSGRRGDPRAVPRRVVHGDPRRRAHGSPATAGGQARTNRSIGRWSRPGCSRTTRPRSRLTPGGSKHSTSTPGAPAAFGSPALCLAYVAAGRIDAFYERDATYAWDVAAGVVDDHRGRRPVRGPRRRARSTSATASPTCWVRTAAIHDDLFDLHAAHRPRV